MYSGYVPYLWLSVFIVLIRLMFLREARSNPDFNLWGGIYGSFLRPCVPLFVMITGILLLPVKMSFEDFY